MNANAIKMWAVILMGFAEQMRERGSGRHMPLWKLTLGFYRLQKRGLISIESNEEFSFFRLRLNGDIKLPTLH